ncbi:hypothetical protein [Streptomyces sp. XH2]|uniref:hypothetical protein n=1 Tax=Streptomyces sp. XH2 TaxID=3412483 RepID=UPI003C7D6A8A
MPSTMMKPALHPIESAAVQAAMRRARTGRAIPLSPDPSVHVWGDELSGVAQVLRHRLRLASLARPVVIRRALDSAHPLLPNGQHYRAIALSIPVDGRALDFLATYNDRRRLTFDLIAPCPRCRKKVPTEEIDCLEDLGDYLLQARDFLGGSPRLRYSPAHTASCPARGD